MSDGADSPEQPTPAYALLAAVRKPFGNLFAADGKRASPEDHPMSVAMAVSRQTVQPVADIGDVTPMLFDPDWYRLEYPDVAWSGVDPILHYFSNGAAEGRNPNPHFDTRAYLLSHPDVKASGMNPFMHFMLYGFREGRRAR